MTLLPQNIKKEVKNEHGWAWLFQMFLETKNARGSSFVKIKLT